MFLYFPTNYMWSLAVLRTLAAGGIFGEVDWVCQHLKEAAKVGGRGDIDAWVESWTKLGDQVYGIGAKAAKTGHSETAAGAFQRAAVYYQWAEGFLVPSDKRATEIFAKHLDAFANFARLHSPRIEIVDIPFENSHLKTYFVPARGVAGRAPAVLLSGGFDGTKEEMCFVATALSARGVHCIAVDQPGQGATLRINGLPARYDSEVAATTVFNWLAGRPDVDEERIGILAASLGGYYAPRAAAFEKRFKACVAWCVIYDYHAVWLRRLNFPEGKPIVMKSDAPFGTVSEQALGIFGAKTWEEALKTLEKFKLDGIAEKIKCDLLVVHGSEDRQTPVEGAERLYREAGSKNKEIWIRTPAEGGAAHVSLDRPEPDGSLICDWISDRLHAG
jgi:alpha-beta hydrolase superfamily lysophospholipase